MEERSPRSSGAASWGRVSMRAAWSQGVDGWDVDLPTFLEANWITNTVAKVLWISVYLLVYGARPMIIRPKSFGAPPGFGNVPIVPAAATCIAEEVPLLPMHCQRCTAEAQLEHSIVLGQRTLQQVQNVSGA